MARLAICNDGTTDLVCDMDCPPNQSKPCENHGGEKTDVSTTPAPAPVSKPLLTQTQKKWLAVIGLTAVAYVILYKAGSLD